MSLWLVFARLALLASLTSAGKLRGKSPLFTGCLRPDHVALTFDDGIGHYTEELLDILSFYQVKATFFILGQTVGDENTRFDEHKRLLIRMIQDGHTVGSHSWDHPDFVDISKEEISQQMVATDSAIKSILGVRPRFMRPPFGHLDKKILKTLRSLGYLVVTWNKDTNDWRHQGTHEAILNFINYEIGNPRPRSEGPIILQHDTLKTAIKLQGKIIRTLKKKGYTFVTLHECLGLKPYRN